MALPLCWHQVKKRWFHEGRISTGGKEKDVASFTKALVRNYDSHGARASSALWRSGPVLVPNLPLSLDELSMPTQRSPTSCPSGSLERKEGEKEVIGDEGQD